MHHIINNTFQTFDTELQPNCIDEYTVEYIPSCEITMQGTIVHQTITILTIHISIITITAII